MVAIGSERTLFLGPRIPNHVKSLGKNLNNIKKPVFRQMVKLAMLDFEGKPVNSDMYVAIKKAVQDTCNVDIIYGALYTLLKCALSFPETSLKQDIFKEDLHELGINGEYIEDLTNVVYGQRRSSIFANFNNIAPHLPKLSNFSWRIDVAISTSTLNRVLEPAIVMEVQLSDGRRETFEVHPSQFHRLRFAVATLLKEIENLEMKSILKN
ncbi:COMM domain-containing protein 5 [Trichonephila inaurata madagascariensis]|uniref:COMM domain-containing protein 5 n=1 Tax=Trichonephila inaurata madagascariensis TaxID=2747483 RepID=A0A8X6MCL0_9ARAC|nr:COMM domain-containing protein 5 [Trichonephila inaurata madagascariensis]